MNEILARIKNIIIRLNHKKGWKPDFTQMVPSSELKQYGIFDRQDTNFIQRGLGWYIDIAALHAAVNRHFKLKKYKELDSHHQNWKTLSDVGDYVQQSLTRRQVEEEQAERAKQKSENQSKCMKEYWAKKKAKKEKDNLVKLWSPLVLEEVYNKLIIDANRATREDRPKEANRIIRKANIIKERMQRILKLIEEKGLLQEKDDNKK